MKKNSFCSCIMLALISSYVWAEVDKGFIAPPSEVALWLDAGRAGWVSDWAGTLAESGQLDGVSVSVHRLPFSLTSLLDRRICFDLPFKAPVDARDYNALELRIHVDDPQALRWMWIIFQSANGRPLQWDGKVLSPGWQNIIIPTSEFSGRFEDWADLRSVRIAYWKGRFRDAVCSISGLRLVRLSELATNVVLNSSFELHSPEGIPLGWGVNHWGIRHQGRMLAINRLRESWGAVADGSSPDGVSCLRLCNVDGFPPIEASSSRFRLLAERDHSISWYARGQCGSGRMQAQIIDPGNGAVYQSETFVLDGDWRRYAFRHRAKKNSGILRFILHPESGEVRIDAVQAEPVVDLDSSIPGRYRSAPRDFLQEVPPEWSCVEERTALRVPNVSRKPLSSPIEVSIRNRCLVVNGSAMIVFSFYHDGRQALSDELLADLGRRGFNTIVYDVLDRNGDVESALAEDVGQISRFARAGLYSIPLFRKSCTAEFISRWASGALINNLNILSLYIYDEPKENDMPMVTAKFNKVKESVSSVPCYINYDNYWRRLPGDIASLDDYPIPNGNPSYAMLADTMWRLGAKEEKPVWFCYQLCGNAYSWYREPTPREQEGMLYALLASRVTGFFAFVNYPLSNDLLDRTSSLLAEIHYLTPVVAGPDCLWQPNPSDGDVMVLAKEHGEERYLITVNTGRYSHAGVRVPLHASWARKVDVVFEGRKADVVGGSVVDDFGPYQRHVYRVFESAKVGADQ